MIGDLDNYHKPDGALLAGVAPVATDDESLEQIGVDDRGGCFVVPRTKIKTSA